MIKTLMALSLFVAACGAEEEEFSLDDLSVRLPDEPPGGKSDEAVTCGDSSCSWDRCGYSCPAGEQCHRACQPRDTRADAFTKLTIGATTLDSRALAYQPVVRLTDVLFHGCELWDFSNGQYDGLEISYRELRQGAFRASDRTTHDHYFMLYTKPFTGPGSYRAEASYAASSEARRIRPQSMSFVTPRWC